MMFGSFDFMPIFSVRQIEQRLFLIRSLTGLQAARNAPAVPVQ
jgi:hypothetical protein